MLSLSKLKITPCNGDTNNGKKIASRCMHVRTSVCVYVSCSYASKMKSNQVDTSLLRRMVKKKTFFSAETWFAVLFTVIVEIVPHSVKAVVIAMFLFLMNNVGGQIPLLITPISKKSELRTALLAIWPGCIGLCK